MIDRKIVLDTELFCAKTNYFLTVNLGTCFPLLTDTNIVYLNFVAPGARIQISGFRDNPAQKKY